MSLDFPFLALSALEDVASSLWYNKCFYSILFALGGASHDSGSVEFGHPLQLYEHRVTSGNLKDDPIQRRVISDLETLHAEIQTYTPQPRPGTGFFSKVCNFFIL